MSGKRFNFEAAAFAAALCALAPLHAQADVGRGRLSIGIQANYPSGRVFIEERETVWLYLFEGGRWRLIGTYDGNDLARSGVATIVLDLPAGVYAYSLIKTTEYTNQPFTTYQCHVLWEVRSAKTVEKRVPIEGCRWETAVHTRARARADFEGFSNLRERWTESIDLCKRWRQKLARVYRELVVTSPSKPVVTIPGGESYILHGGTTVSELNDREWTAAQVRLFRKTLQYHCGQWLLAHSWPADILAEERALAAELEDRLRYELAEVDKLIEEIARTLE